MFGLFSGAKIGEKNEMTKKWVRKMMNVEVFNVNERVIQVV
jgi:hypothetical protein